MLAASLVLAMQLQAVVPADARVVPVWALPPAQDTEPRKRRRAIQYSDAYYTRLTIHRYASYAELPLFAAEYALGQRILNGQELSLIHI